jgi:trk system potassium uptake protein TrkH
VTFLIVEWDAALAPMSGPGDRVLASIFQSVSARTAGFATISYAEAHSPTLFLWIALMGIGGAAGSTAGGIKLATFAVLVLAVISTIRGQTETQFSGRQIPTQLVFRAMTIATLYFGVHFMMTLLLTLTEDIISDGEFGFLPLMFETMSALATVGISTGITGEITTAGKLVLCVAMFVGRLGPLTVMYALQRRETPKNYSYPESYVRLG